MNELDNMKQMMLLVESAEQLDEIDFKKAAATAMAVGALAGGVGAEPQSSEKYDNTEPHTPEYNVPSEPDDYVRPEFDQDRAEALAYKVISGMGYDTFPNGYGASVQDVGSYSIEVKVYYKGTLGFRDNATVILHMDMQGRIDDVDVGVASSKWGSSAGKKLIQDHPIFKKVIGYKISK